MKLKRFISIQTGARRNYAVPVILEKAGMLEAFYTDLCANYGLGAMLDRFCPKSLKNGALKRLLNRQIPTLLEKKVHTFDFVTLRYLARQKLAKNNLVKNHQALRDFDSEFARSMISRGSGEATHIFSMFGEGSDFLGFAKAQGLKVMTEIYLSPLTHSIVQQERKKYPDIEKIIPEEIIQRDCTWFKKNCQVTDKFIVPSEFVIEGLKEFGVTSDKCDLVPYGVSDSWFKVENYPTKGRILFVGTAELRKGIHILGMAAKKLSHHEYEFRVAGGVSDTVRNHELTQKLHFLGRVARADISLEFAQADIFVLPSLAEGSAEVIYEALALGLPVITTKAAGSVIRDGIEGFIVSEGDYVTLAQKIEELVENRELRNRMAVAAKELASNYTWDKYAERLLTALAA